MRKGSGMSLMIDWLQNSTLMIWIMNVMVAKKKSVSVILEVASILKVLKKKTEMHIFYFTNEIFFMMIIGIIYLF